jgi:putative N6-adenine-specific DNA methylase
VCRLSIDATGEPLYMRGYKRHAVKAPIRETLASLILRAACAMEYDTIIDPMAGSGSFPIEAAMMSEGIFPGWKRDFIFEKWPSFRPAAYRHMRGQLEINKKPSSKQRKIYAFDVDEKAVSAIRGNAALAGVEGILTVDKMDFLKGKLPSGGKTLIVMNPPYGNRVGSEEEISKFYSRMGEKIRTDYSGCGFAIIVPGMNYEKLLGLNYDLKIPFINGGIKVALLIKK